MPKSTNEDDGSYELQQEEKRRKAKRLERIHFIADKVEEARANNESIYGIITKHVKEGKHLYPTITNSTIKNEIRRRKIRREREATSTNNKSTNDTIIPEDSSNDTTNTPTNSVINSELFGSDFEMVADLNKDSDDGRPKGTTEDNKIQLEKAKRLERIHFIADKVEEARANNESVYGIITKHVKEGKHLYPTITDSTIKNEIRRRKIRREREAAKKSTDDTIIPKDSSNDTTNTPTNSIMNSELFGSDFEMVTTEDNKIQLKKAKIAAMNLIAEMYSKEIKERRKRRGKNARLKRGRLEAIIANTKREFNLPKDVKIKTSAIRTRLAEGRKLKVVSQGCEPPIYEFEPLLVEWLSLAYNSRMCLSVGNALCLANSLISGTVYERKMIDFKQHRKMSYDPNCVLEETWFKGFMKRNEDKLTCMRGHSFSLDRDSWSTYQNMNAMYDMIEACLIDCGIAEKIDPIWVDKEGKEVVSEEDAYGCKCTIRIIHPDYMLCVDEVGSNIDMTGDGHAGGELYISVAKKGPPQIKISTKNKHWTTLGLTAMNGEPVMCVLIFASKKKDAYRELGVDCTVDLDGEIEDFETVHD